MATRIVFRKCLPLLQLFGFNSKLSSFINLLLPRNIYGRGHDLVFIPKSLFLIRGGCTHFRGYIFYQLCSILVQPFISLKIIT